METQKLLEELALKIQQGAVSEHEVVRLFADMEDTHKKKTRFSLVKVLYTIGIAIVLIGIVTFFAQVWDGLSSAIRIIVTLGFGLIVAFLGSILIIKKKNILGLIFHFLGAFLIMGGMVVFINELSIKNDFGVAFLFLGIAALYLILRYVHKHSLFIFFSIATLTISLFLFTGAFLEISTGVFDTARMYRILSILIGISYVLLGFHFQSSWDKYLVRFLYLAGSFGVLLSFFLEVLSGGLNSVLMISLYFLVLIGSAFVSILVRSKVILFVTTLFLLIHLSYITGKYFADSIGWPISLVILGFLFIGLGYLSVSINRKYIQIK